MKKLRLYLHTILFIILSWIIAAESFAAAVHILCPDKNPAASVLMGISEVERVFAQVINSFPRGLEPLITPRTEQGLILRRHLGPVLF